MVALYPYQREGVKFLRANHRCILGDEMGLGKTVQVLMALDETTLPAVVVCPAVVRLVWASEAAKFRPDLTTEVVENGKQKAREADLTIISYDLFGKAPIPRPKLIVADEAHYLQSHEARRTRVMFAAAGKAYGKASLPLWMLTGTPIWSRPRSLYPLLFLCGEVGKNYKGYADKYCDRKLVRRRTKAGWRRVWDDSGASNLDELAGRTAPYLLRRLKKLVLPELPAKRRQVIRLDARLSAVEEGAWAEGHISDYMNVGMGSGGLPPGPIATAVRETALRKMGPCIDHITNVLEHEDKVVVFAWNRAVIEALVEGLHHKGGTGVAVVTGITPAEYRRTAVEEFQTNPKIRVFIGQTAAAGVGITLTAASTAIFVQPDWTGVNLDQAEDRIHRIGQRDSVLIQYLVTADSVEEFMLSTAIDKTVTAETILRDPNQGD